MRRGLLVAVLITLGWAAGRAQVLNDVQRPDFMFIVRGPVGDIRVECVRNCKVTTAKGLNEARNYRASDGGTCAVDKCGITLWGVVTK